MALEPRIMELEIRIPTDLEGYQYVTLVAERDEVIAGSFDKYDPTKLVTGLPPYLEPAFIAGEQILPCDDKKTFNDFGIKEGKTLHVVLRVREVNVFIHNVCDNETASVDMLLSTTVANLKKVIRRDERLSVYRFDEEELVLKLGDIPLNETRTLLEYGIENYTQLNLDLRPYSLSMLVPTYVGMENVVVQPNETIAAIVKKIKKVQEFKYSIETTNKKMIVRSAVRNTRRGILTYIYLDLFSGGTTMRVFMDESTDEVKKRYSLVVENTNTVNDIYDRIAQHQDLVVDESALSEWPKCHRFDGTWTRTFAPQVIETASSLLVREGLTLFFFPQRLKIVSLGITSPYCTVAEIKARVCRAEGIKENTRAVIQSFTENYLNEQQQLHKYHTIFSSEYCLTLARLPGQQVITTDHIKVYIKWPSRPTSELVAVAVEPEDTVIHLKYMIEDELNVPLFMQKLSHEGDSLKMNNQSLASYGIREGSVVHLVPISGDEFFFPYAETDDDVFNIEIFYDRQHHLRSNFASLCSTKL